nr:RNA-directed DNA polymerase [Tanacetum cinerariifolium]
MFPAGRYGKLQARAGGPFRVLKRINDNAYKIELPGHYNVSATFNVRSAQIKELHAQVRDTILKHTGKYQARANKHRKQVVYKEVDLVWIHLRKERFPAGRYGKLHARADGPFRVLKRINDNAYKIKLPGHYNVSATFNVADLSPYEGDSK